MQNIAAQQKENLPANETVTVFTPEEIEKFKAEAFRCWCTGKCDGTEAQSEREVKIGKLKSASSRRDVPLNNTAIEMINELRKEFYFGEDTPLVCDENGDFTRPVNFRKDITEYWKQRKLKRKVCIA